MQQNRVSPTFPLKCGVWKKLLSWSGLKAFRASFVFYFLVDRENLRYRQTESRFDSERLDCFFAPLFLLSLNYAYILFFILVTTVLELVRQIEGRRQGEGKKRES